MNPATPTPDTQRSIHAVTADFFRILGHPVRVRVLELLKGGEMSVGEIQASLGIDSSGASQHLSAMRRRGILAARKHRTSVFYSVRDPRIFQMLESARQVIGSHLEEAEALLQGLAPGARTAVTRAR